MKSRLIFPLRAPLFFLVFSVGLYLLDCLQVAKAEPESPVYAWTPENIDPDALAARMKTAQELYPKIRDEALNAYAKAHPAPNPYDDDAKKLIKLTTYICIWGDLMRESLWSVETELAQKIHQAGGDDPLVQYVWDASLKHLGAQDAESFANTAYPDLLKAWVYRETISEMDRSKDEGADAARDKAAALADMIPKWGHLYEQLIRKPLSNSVLFHQGINLIEGTDSDESALTAVNNCIDQAFTKAAPDNSLKDALDGAYWTKEAWLARGSDWANTVTEPQWAKFREDLGKADTILEAAYAKHPEEPAISVLMLTVELGQGQGRPRMEQWFQRAIKADPQNGGAYSGKYNYLQPRWYGSVDDLVAFGKECLALQDPPPSALSGFGINIALALNQEPDVYSRPEVWIPLEKMYRQYLAQYPQSKLTRTAFAMHAAQSERWNIVKEQFALLGDAWDRSVMKQADYDKYTASMNAATGK